MNKLSKKFVLALGLVLVVKSLFAIEICNDLMVKQPKKVVDVDVVKGEEKLEELVQQHQELQNKDFKVEEIEIELTNQVEEVKHHSKNKQNKYR